MLWREAAGRVRPSRAAFGDFAIAGPNHATVQPLQMSLIPPVSPVFPAPPPVLRGYPGKKKKKSRLGLWIFSPLYAQFQLYVLKVSIVYMLPVVG